MKNRPDDELLASYLSGECSEQKKINIETWINSDPKNQKFIEIMKNTWESSKKNELEWDKQKLWQKITKETGIANDYKSLQNIYTIKNKIHFSQIWKIAAIFILATALPYFLFFYSSSRNNLDNMNTILVENGKHKIITMTDGSKITLDAGSSFSYQKTYNEQTREVYLNGEGYFEVNSNSSFPFVVHANNAIVKVLGTKFNVRAWYKNRYVKVAVSEGKVFFNSESGTDEDAVYLSGGQLSELLRTGKPTQPKEVDIQNFISWVNHEINFEDTPLDEILFQIERWHDVNFTLADSTIRSEHLNIHIQNNSLNELLDMISMLTEMRYKKENKKIYLGK